MKNNSKILICYNSPVSIFSIYNGKPSSGNESLNDLSETAFSKEIKKIKKSLLENYSDVKALAVDRNIIKTINAVEKYSPDAIINFVESIEGVSSYEYCMAGVYQLMGYHFTGNTPICLGNCLDKAKTKNILRSMGINTPASQTIKISNKFSQKDFNLKYPVILKLLREDASIGISEFSVVYDFKSLKKQLKFLQETYKQDILVEEYIDGRELNAAILNNEVLPISEIKFNSLPEGLPKIVTYDGKWIENSIYYNNTVPECPARLNKSLKKKIEETALLAYNAMGCRDYARVDVRISRTNVPFVIEVNPNPDVSSDSGFARAAAAAGINYAELLNKIAGYALDRKDYDSKAKAS